MITATCARCHQPIEIGAWVVEVRKVTRVHPDNNTLTHDRGDAVAHVLCPNGDTE